MDSEIEQLADRQGFLKLTSMPQWLRVSLPLAPPLPSRLVADPRQRTPPADAAGSLLAQVSADAREAWKVQRKAPRSAGAAHVASVPSPPEVAPVRASRPTRKSPKSSGVVHGR